MNYQERFYPESRFGGFTDIDGTVAFYIRIQALLRGDSIILDVGCGRGSSAVDPVLVRRELRNLRGRVRKVIGVDVDRVGETNPLVDDFRLIKGADWPVESNTIDLVLSDSVLEHLLDPIQFFSEVVRVLKDGGYLCIRTANAWSYIALASRLVPNRYQANVLAKAQNGRAQEDVFPTYYRCNSIRRIRKLMASHDFEHAVYGYEAEPSYLSFSSLSYWAGVLHQRFAPKVMKPAIFAFGKLAKDSTSDK